MNTKPKALPCRIGHLDMVKAFAIFLVFIGHKISSITAESYIYSFHLPLFFWISGFVFNPAKYEQFSKFFFRRLRTIIVPYFIFALASYTFWVVIVRRLSVRGQVLSLEPWYPFWGTFYGVGVGQWRNPLDIALWFLPCLFMTSMIFWYINKYLSYTYRVPALFVIGAIGYMTSVWLPFRLPWSTDVALSAVVFYGAGHLSRKWNDQLTKLKLPWKAVLLVSLAGIGLYVSFINGKADMNYNSYGNPLLFYCAAFAGIYFWYYTIRIICYRTPLGVHRFAPSLTTCSFG